jgi:iron-sulfur cluster repair protein YtfE (RIC family)
MNTVLPIKRHQAIVSFSKDHHFVLLLVWKIRRGLAKAVQPERISRYVLYFFEQDLQHHLADEEVHLFCRLPADNTLRKQAEQDHAYLRKLIAAIRCHPEFSELLETLANTIERHVRFEERELFNILQAFLGETELTEIALRLQYDNKSVDENWPDHFWDTL